MFNLGFRLTQLQHRTPKTDKKSRLEDILYINLWPLETNLRYSTGSGSTRNSKSSKLPAEEHASPIVQGRPTGHHSKVKN